MAHHHINRSQKFDLGRLRFPKKLDFDKVQNKLVRIARAIVRRKKMVASSSVAEW